MWDGLRGAGDLTYEQAQEPPGAGAEPALQEAESAEQVREPRTGSGTDSTGGGRELHVALDAAVRSARRRLERGRGDDDPGPDASPGSGKPRGGAREVGAQGSLGSMPTRVVASASGSRVRATPAIPVPPRVEGGWLGSLFSTIVLALEVLVSLVGSIVRGAAVGLRSLSDRLARRSGSFLGTFTSGAAFFVVMMVLGAVVMTVGMLFLSAVGWS